MGKKLVLNFCIITNPFSNGRRNMVFVSKKGDNYLNRSIHDTEEYADVKEILEQFGYTEVGPLQFESSNNMEPEITVADVSDFLEDCGLVYSRELEVNIVKDFDNIVVEEDASFNYGPHDEFGNTDTSIPEKTKNKLIESKGDILNFKYKEPEFREKVTLYLYLFLKFGFNQDGKPVIEFSGDFKDSEDYDNRNYIKILKSDFERVRDKSKPNAIILKSCKLQEDIIKEVGLLYSGYFRYQETVETEDSLIVQDKKYPYKFADVRKYISPDKSIVVETTRMGYDTLIELSNEIKQESEVEKRQTLSMMDIQSEAENLNKFLKRKIERLSAKEEFEEAAMIKKDIDFIEDKLEHIKSLDKGNITTEEYFSIFSAS
jgi:hypothetical protein